MSTEIENRRRYRFGVFQLDTLSGELYKHGIRLKLQVQPCQVLALLLEKPGEMVTREELRQRLWDRDTYIDFDHSLNISINKLREALGDSAANPRFIETLPRRGYRFLAPVTSEAPSATVSAFVSAPLETQSTPSVVQPDVVSTDSTKKKNAVTIWLIIAAVVVIALAVGGWRIWTQYQKSSAPRKRVMLAVLPFEDLTGNKNEDFFIAGLHDEMIAQLGRLFPSRLGVIARTSVVRYATMHEPIDQIGRELHVDYVLDGTVRMVNGRFRITAELIQVSDQTHLWVETYEPGMGDVLKLQEDVAGKVAQALSMEFLPDAREQLRQNTTSNAAAYEAYLKGRYLWYEETESSLRQAITEFQSAIKLDPNYAPAYVGLADAYNVLGGYGFVPVGDALPKGKAAAAKALELGPNLSDAYASMAFVAFYYDWNWPESEELFRKTLSLNPNNAVGHEFYSSYLHAMGRLDDAEKESRIAQELDPLSGWVRDDMGWILLSRRRPEAAVAEFRKAIELNPKFPAAHLSLAVAYSRLGKYSDALQEVQKAEELGGSPTRVLEVRGSVQAMSGDSVGAQKTLGQLMSGTVKGRISPYSIALIYTAMGRKSEALDWLEKAYNEKDTWIVWTKVLMEWDSLRSEPRFQVLQKKLNF